MKQFIWIVLLLGMHIPCMRVCADQLSDDLAHLKPTLSSLNRRLRIIQPFQPVHALKFDKGFSLSRLYNEVKKQNEFGLYMAYNPKTDTFGQKYLLVPSLINTQVYFKTIEAFKALMISLMQQDLWMRSDVPQFEKHFNLIAQKVIINPPAELAFFGDIHGSLHSLVRILKRFIKAGYLADDLTIIKKDFYMVFLGDYVDRGAYGPEVLFVLMTLKLKNPERVCMVRGNHDDYAFDKIFNISGKYAMHNQIDLKLKSKDVPDPIKRVYSIFAYMPEVIYLGFPGDKGMNIMQASHGAFEFGYDPGVFLRTNGKTFDWVHSIDRASFVSSLSPKTDKLLLDAINKTIKPEHLVNFTPKGLITARARMRMTRALKMGFSWHEFIVGDDKKIVDSVSGEKTDREIIYGKKFTEFLLARYSAKDQFFRGIVRGHQHHDAMELLLLASAGMFPLWNNKVITLFSGPSNYPDARFVYDSVLMLSVTPAYKNWKYDHRVCPIKGLVPPDIGIPSHVPKPGIPTQSAGCAL